VESHLPEGLGSSVGFENATPTPRSRIRSARGMKRSGGTVGRNAGCSCKNRRSPNVVGAQPHGDKEEERSSGPGFRDLIWEEDRSRPMEGGGGAAAAHAGWGRGTNVGVGVWTV
jgi:hypothetical protein